MVILWRCMFIPKSKIEHDRISAYFIDKQYLSGIYCGVTIVILYLSGNFTNTINIERVVLQDSHDACKDKSRLL